MFHQSKSIGLLALLTIVFYVRTSPVDAKDHFLTIGGGYSPTGNQVSLEKNVVFLQSVLAEKRPDQPAHDIFFADGDDSAPDVQYRDPTFRETCPLARRMMAEILGDADEMDLRYRNHQIANVRGPAELSGIRRRMRQIAADLKSGDRLLIYATGHGGAADNPAEYRYNENRDSRDRVEAPYNHYDTSLYVWDHESVSASEFAGWLDQVPQDVGVVLVMVQCYAGGFAHAIFREANSDLGLAPHARCGFFAQMHDRGAAGCTPDIKEADYQEYSSFFWAALAGRTRTGDSVTAVDLNGDGQVSFLEAHAHAVIESDTIDVPVMTSGELLRTYSQSAKVKNDAEGNGENPLGRIIGMFGRTDGTAASGKAIVELKGPLKALVERARPDQRAVVERLTAKLELGVQPSVESIRRKLEDVHGKTMVANAKLQAATSTYSNLHERVQERVREIWPELNHDFAPLAMELTSDRADEFVATVRGKTSYDALVRARELQRQASEERLRLERTEAKLQRLLRACEDIILAANLPSIAPAEIVTRYEKLVALESGTLTEAPTTETRKQNE